eukprot:TRINITY_DN13859_c0_g1_i1.p1 TRINITY_DN13859_c0_g1~~TRINITY_DN13859_c0_g1_i1.p1  ORF type:complete len:292 (-),score=20.91 TRINITY_DN13859_c0_g1_i1:304-1179(-)
MMMFRRVFDDVVITVDQQDFKLSRATVGERSRFFGDVIPRLFDPSSRLIAPFGHLRGQSFTLDEDPKVFRAVLCWARYASSTTSDTDVLPPDVPRRWAEVLARRIGVPFGVEVLSTCHPSSEPSAVYRQTPTILPPVCVHIVPTTNPKLPSGERQRALDSVHRRAEELAVALRAKASSQPCPLSFVVSDKAPPDAPVLCLWVSMLGRSGDPTEHQQIYDAVTPAASATSSTSPTVVVYARPGYHNDKLVPPPPPPAMPDAFMVGWVYHPDDGFLSERLRDVDGVFAALLRR